MRVEEVKTKKEIEANMISRNDQEHLFSNATFLNSNVSKCKYLYSQTTQHMTPERGYFIV